MCLILAAVFCIWIPDFSTGFIIWCFWIDAAILFPYLPYICCNRRLKDIKRQQGWQRKERETAVNISAAAAPVRWISPWMFLLPLLISLLPFLYERQMKFLYLTDAAMIVFCFGAYRFLYRQRAETVDSSQEITEALSRIRRYNWGKCWLWCAWSMAALNLICSLTWKHTVLMLALTLLVSFILVLAVTGVEFRTRRMQEKLTAESGMEYYVDEDDCWIWGIFYYNPNDTHVIVNQRIGIGTTFNMARRSGQIVTGLAILLLLAMPLVGVWMKTEENTPVTLALTEDSIAAAHGNDCYRVPLDRIEAAELVTELFDMQKVWGTGMNSVQKGSYCFDRGMLTACLDPRTGPWILMESEDGYYLFGSSEEGAAETIYQEMTK